MIGAQLRDAGIAQVSLGKEEWLSMVRECAKSIAAKEGTVTINDLRERFTLPIGAHHNLWGAVFKSKQFKVVGFGTATHPQAHARRVCIYSTN